MEDDDFQIIISQEEHKKLVSQKNLAQVSMARTKEELKKLQQTAIYQQDRRDKQIEFLSLLLRSFTESVLNHRTLAEGQKQKSETHWYESIDLSLQKSQEKSVKEMKNSLIKKYLVQLNNMTKIKKSISWQLQLISDQDERIKTTCAQLKAAESEHARQTAKIIHMHDEQIAFIKNQSHRILEAQKMISRNLQAELNNKESFYNEKIKQQIQKKQKELEKEKQIAQKANNLVTLIKVENKNLKEAIQKLQSQQINIKKQHSMIQTIPIPDLTQQIKNLKKLLSQREDQSKKLNNQNSQLQMKIKEMRKENNKLTSDFLQQMSLLEQITKQMNLEKDKNSSLKRIQDQLRKACIEKQSLKRQNETLKKETHIIKMELNAQKLIVKQQDEEIQCLGKMIDDITSREKISPKKTSQQMEQEKKKGIKSAINQYYHEIESNLLGMNALEKNDIVEIIDHQLQLVKEHIDKIINQNRKRAQ